MSKNRLANPATTKQENFIKKLDATRVNFDALTPEQHDYLSDFRAQRHLERDQASYLITGLLKCEEQPRGEMAKPGYYVSGQKYLVVVSNRAGTATYAKELQVTKEPGRRAKARWVYAPGEGRNVAHLTPMTLEQAAKFGHLHGVCFVCCRALTDPESVKRGIGPVCATKFGGRR